jgi:hypothetical protein
MAAVSVSTSPIVASTCHIEPSPVAGGSEKRLIFPIAIDLLEFGFAIVASTVVIRWRVSVTCEALASDDSHQHWCAGCPPAMNQELER